MNKFVFRLLVLLMSISLLGIIFVQVYWFNTSLEKSEEQFKFHIKQVLGNVAKKLQSQEEYAFYSKVKKLKDSTGKAPRNEDLMEYKYYQRNTKTNETIIYSNSIISEDYDIFSTLFDKKSDNSKIKSYTAQRKTQIFNNNSFDNPDSKNKLTPDITIQKSGSLDILERAGFEIQYKDIVANYPIQDRVSKESLYKILTNELKEYGVKTPFEFNVYNQNILLMINMQLILFLFLLIMMEITNILCL